MSLSITSYRGVAGDEIRLKHPCPNIGAPPWTGSGLVVRLNETSEEVQRSAACRAAVAHIRDLVSACLPVQAIAYTSRS